MPRRKKKIDRSTKPDPIYKSTIVTKIINRSMKDGKKTASQKQVYGALEKIKKETKDDPMKVLNQAMSNVKPTMEVRPRRVGGAAYQVPMPVRGRRKESLAIRWIIFAARAKSNSEFKTYAEKLAAELMDAANGEGGAVKKRTEMERMAEANRAFSHFRW